MADGVFFSCFKIVGEFLLKVQEETSRLSVKLFFFFNVKLSVLGFFFTELPDLLLVCGMKK